AGSITPIGLILGAGLMALAALASTVITRAVLAAMPGTPGLIVSAIAGIVQLGLVGYVWKTATTGEIDTIWQVLASLTPLNWATTGLISAGNDGSTTMLWTSAVVLAAIVILGFVVVGLNRRPQQQFADSLDDDPTPGPDYADTTVSTS